LRYMREDAEVGVVISSVGQPGLGEEARLVVEEQEEQSGEKEKEGEENLEQDRSGERLAYVMYTSGSTGRPKGVMVHQRGMLNHVQAKVKSLGLKGSDIVAQNAPSSFDISVWQMLAVLLVGGRVEIVGEEKALDAGELIGAVEEKRVTVLETVPTMLGMLVEAGREKQVGLGGLRWLISNAEGLGVSLCREWFEAWPEVE